LGASDREEAALNERSYRGSAATGAAKLQRIGL